MASGETVGIDPQSLAELTTSLKSRADAAQGLVNYYIGQLNRVGIPSGELTTAGQDLTWATDQVPMLNRRHTLAQALEQQDPQLGPMVEAGAGVLDFATAGAAQKAGAAAGAKALQALQDRDNDDFIEAELRKYGDDPTYLAAFFQALGPRGLAMLGLQVNGYEQDGDGAKYQLWSTTVGSALATASYQLPFSDNWLTGLTLTDSQTPGPQLSLIQPFLEHGVYSADWLQPLANYALGTAHTEALDPDVPQVPLDGIWTAIADNPGFDAKFYSENFTNSKDPNFSISWLVSSLGGEFVNDAAFANMMRAATIAPAHLPAGVNAAQFAANAQATVRQFGADPGMVTSSSIRETFAAITMRYFDSLSATVGAAAPGFGSSSSTPGLEVSAPLQDWAGFVKQAMEDPTAAAQLITFYGAWYDKYGGAEAPTQWTNFASGSMDAFMAQTYKAANTTAGDNSDKIADILESGGAAFLTSIVFPEGDASVAVGALLSAAAKDGEKDAFQSAAEDGLSAIFGQDGSPSQGASGITSDLDSMTTPAGRWSRLVNQWYTDHAPLPAGSPVSPQPYIKQYGGKAANFIVTDPITGKPTPMDPAKMSGRQLAAYNAWLESPAFATAAAQAADGSNLFASFQGSNNAYNLETSALSGS